MKDIFSGRNLIWFLPQLYSIYILNYKKYLFLRWSFYLSLYHVLPFSPETLLYSSEIFCYIYSKMFSSLHSGWLLSFKLIYNDCFIELSSHSNSFQFILLGQFNYLILILYLFSNAFVYYFSSWSDYLAWTPRTMLNNGGVFLGFPIWSLTLMRIEWVGFITCCNERDHTP